MYKCTEQYLLENFEMEFGFYRQFYRPLCSEGNYLLKSMLKQKIIENSLDWLIQGNFATIQIPAILPKILESIDYCKWNIFEHSETWSFLNLPIKCLLFSKVFFKYINNFYVDSRSTS